MSSSAAVLTNQSDGKLVPDYRRHLKPAWKPGERPEGAGKPVGARNKLSERFIQDIYTHWQANGKEALAKLYEADIAAYVKAIVALIPKQSAHVRVNANTSRPLDSINAELIQAVQALGYNVSPAQGMVIDSQAETPQPSNIPTGGLVQTEGDSNAEGEEKPA